MDNGKWAMDNLVAGEAGRHPPGKAKRRLAAQRDPVGGPQPKQKNAQQGHQMKEEYAFHIPLSCGCPLAQTMGGTY
jgi:hypothetical protein